MRLIAPETPPLTRGRRTLSVPRPLTWGNTPAYAGKTQAASWRGRKRAKHPRLRGEDFRGRGAKLCVSETPPLTRGRLRGRRPVGRRRGNTPAYAGKTRFRRSFGTRGRKHPRLRGEDQDAGRPPEVRRGNTPAYAGKTPSSHWRGWRGRKHPRLRGEDGEADERSA